MPSPSNRFYDSSGWPPPVGRVVVSRDLLRTEFDNVEAGFIAVQGEMDAVQAELTEVGVPSNDNPLMDGVATPGTSLDISRKDHRHPTDTSRASASDLENSSDPTKGAALIGYKGRTVYRRLQAIGVSVQDVGAVGDGVTDDTEAIQEAINYCTADVNNPKKLIFEEGDYSVTSGFNKITCKNFIIEAEGRGVEYFSPVGTNNQGVARIIYNGVDDSNGWIFDIENARGFQIRQLSILCSSKCNGIRGNLSSNLLIEKIGLFEAYTGLKLVASCFASVIDNIVSYDHSVDHIVFDATAHSSKILNSSFASNSLGTTAPNSVVTIGGTAAMSAIKISGNNFDVWRVPVFILAKRVYGLGIGSNYFEPRDITLTRYIQLGDQAENAYCQGVSIYGGNKLFGKMIVGDGVRIEKAYGVSIAGNVFNNMTNAVNCANTGESVNKNANGISINGNRFGTGITGYGATIDHDYSSNVVMLGNTGVADYSPSNIGKALHFADGTFTPTLAFGGASTGITYTTNVGRFKKIGNRLFFQIRIVLSNKGSSTGVATIKGLPFTSASNIPQAVEIDLAGGFSGLTGSPKANISINATDVLLYQTTSSGRIAITDAVFWNTATLTVTGFYELA